MDSVAQRLFAVGAGAALELRGVTRLFGALAALTDVTLTVRPGERRAVLGSNGAGKTTLFNCITGDFPPTSGTIRFFGEDVTHFPPYERIRRGLRRTYQISALFPGLTVLDNVYLACCGVSRGRFSLLRPGAERRADAGGRRPGAGRPSDRREGAARRRTRPRPAAPARDRAGARRRAALHPVRRAGGRALADRAAELVEILTSLPAHIGYIIIEHDMDVALRVVESVTMMHNGRIFKEGLPREIESDPEVQELYLGGGHG